MGNVTGVESNLHCRPFLRQAGLPALPSDVQMKIASLDPPIYILWPLLCKQMALETRFTGNFQKIGTWFRYALRGRKRARLENKACVWVLKEQRSYGVHDDVQMLHGMQSCWYDNGALKARYETNTGNIVGQLEYYYPEGQIKIRAMYVNGKKHGPHDEWWANGRQKKNIATTKTISWKANIKSGIDTITN